MNYQAALVALSAAPGWRKSARSEGANACVEITTAVPGWVGVRDSKLGTTSPLLAFTRSEWTAMLTGARTGELDAQRSN